MPRVSWRDAATQPQASWASLGGGLLRWRWPSYGQCGVSDGRSGLEAAFLKLSLPALCPQTPDMLLGMADNLVMETLSPW